MTKKWMKSEMIELRKELKSSLEYYDRKRNWDMACIADRQIAFLQKKIETCLDDDDELSDGEMESVRNATEPV